MKKLVILMTVGLLFSGLAWLLYAGVSDSVVIDGIKAKKAAVTFPHKAHADKVDCKKCHHTFDGTGDPAKCTSCHQLEDGDAPKGYTAFHAKTAENSCLGCHKAGGAGPTKCVDCHPKE